MKCRMPYLEKGAVMDTRDAADSTASVTAFDTLFTNNHIQMLKILLPYMDDRIQKSMAVLIKFMELSYTMDFYRNNPFPLWSRMEKPPALNISQLCGALLPFCTGAERKQLNTLQEMMKGMEMYQEMQNTMELMKNFMPEGGFDMTELMNMLTPEQKQMYEQFTQNKER